MGGRGGIIVPPGWRSVPSSCDRGSNAFFHFHHLFLHTVLEDHHVVDEVLAGGRAVEQVLRESCVLQGRPLFVQSWQRSIVTSPSSGIVQMLLPASEKVSGISFSDQILATGQEKPTLWAVFPLGCWEAVSDQEDANLVGEGRGLWDVGYGRDRSEKAVRLEDCVSVWVC